MWASNGAAVGVHSGRQVDGDELRRLVARAGGGQLIEGNGHGLAGIERTRLPDAEERIDDQVAAYEGRIERNLISVFATIDEDDLPLANFFKPIFAAWPLGM